MPRDADITGDTGVAVEYNIRQSSTRIYVTLTSCGSNYNRTPSPLSEAKGQGRGRRNFEGRSGRNQDRGGLHEHGNRTADHLNEALPSPH